jgi:hypothetical protein
MTPLKFRVWNNNLKRYVDDVEWFLSPDGRVWFNDMMDEGLILAKHCIAERMTNLVDKNGSPLYCGDIVRIYGMAVPVDDCNLLFLLSSNVKLNLIGNIHVSYD